MSAAPLRPYLANWLKTVYDENTVSLTAIFERERERRVKVFKMLELFSWFDEYIAFLSDTRIVVRAVVLGPVPFECQISIRSVAYMGEELLFKYEDMPSKEAMLDALQSQQFNYMAFHEWFHRVDEEKLPDQIHLLNHSGLKSCACFGREKYKLYRSSEVYDFKSRYKKWALSTHHVTMQEVGKFCPYHVAYIMLRFPDPLLVMDLFKSYAAILMPSLCEMVLEFAGLLCLSS